MRASLFQRADSGIMKFGNTLIAAIGSLPLLSLSAHAVQSVDFVNITRNGVAGSNPLFVAGGDVIRFGANLTANGGANPPGTSGLGLCLEYKRAATGDPAISNVLPTGNVGTGNPAPVSGCGDGGPNPVPVPGTDYMVITAWAALTGPGWPNVALPVKLFDAQFTVPATPTAPAPIGFGASSVAGGQTFTGGGPLILCGRPTVTLNRVANGVEGGAPAAFDVVLSTPVPAQCGISSLFQVAMTLGGTATPPGANGDYTISGSGITLAAGNVVVASFPADGATTSLRVIATPTVDGVAEGAETLTLTVGPGTGNYSGVGANASATINDGAAAAVVVEYVDTVDFPTSPGGHYFYSSDPAEQAAVDAGAAGHFQRTGRTFLTGGSVPVCRFYGSLSPGPNSHFFTADAAECATLKAAQVVPTPTTVQQWNYERDEYLTTPVTVNPADGSRSCPAGTLPLYRAYNNAFPPGGGKNPWDSNHRFSPVQSVIATLVQQVGWRDEGLAYCTPAQ
jgi:hypothetical protein